MCFFSLFPGKPIFSVDIHPDGTKFATGGQGRPWGAAGSCAHPCRPPLRRAPVVGHSQTWARRVLSAFWQQVSVLTLVEWAPVEGSLHPGFLSTGRLVVPRQSRRGLDAGFSPPSLRVSRLGRAPRCPQGWGSVLVRGGAPAHQSGTLRSGADEQVSLHPGRKAVSGALCGDFDMSMSRPLLVFTSVLES